MSPSVPAQGPARGLCFARGQGGRSSAPSGAEARPPATRPEPALAGDARYPVTLGRYRLGRTLTMAVALLTATRAPAAGEPGTSPAPGRRGRAGRLHAGRDVGDVRQRARRCVRVDAQREVEAHALAGPAGAGSRGSAGGRCGAACGWRSRISCRGGCDRRPGRCGRCRRPRLRAVIRVAREAAGPHRARVGLLVDHQVGNLADQGRYSE